MFGKSKSYSGRSVVYESRGIRVLTINRDRNNMFVFKHFVNVTMYCKEVFSSDKNVYEV